MMGQRQLVLLVEATGALGGSWPVLFSEYVDKIVRAFCDESAQKLSGSPGEMALVVFTSHGPHAGCLIQQSGWTSSMDVFFKWLSAISFVSGGFGEAAIAEALAEALMMCCPGPKVPPASQVIERQKHCLLIAASNPYRLPTPVIRPPASGLGGPEPPEQWWLADAEAVAKAFPTCQVSLSIIAPRQLPNLRNMFSGAKRSNRTPEVGSDASKQYNQHLVLISEAFTEGWMAVHRTAVTTNGAVPSGLSAAKLEPLMTTTSTVQSQPTAQRPSAVSATMGNMLGRPTISNGAGSVSMDNQSVLHSNVGTTPLQMQHPSTSGLSGADTIQSSDNSASSQAKVGPVAGNPSTLGHMSNTATQPRQLPTTTTLGVVNGSGAGLPGASVNTAGAPSTMMTNNQPSSLTGQTTSIAGQSTNLSVNGSLHTGNNSVLTGVGTVSNSVGMNTGIGHSTLGGGALNTNANLVGPTGGLGPNQLAPSPAVTLQAGGGAAPGVGAGQPQPNSMGGIPGMGGTTGALGTAGVNTGINAMVATPGHPQPGQSVQPLGAASSLSSVTGHGMAAVATPPQQASGSLKYTKLWEGILAGQRQQKPVPICKLEGYRQTSSSEKLAADWPPTMQIVRLIAQDYMNSKDYQGKAELLVFRPLSSHGFLVQLAEKKLCAVIQLPTQTLLLASTDKPGRMIGMLFPGDMVVFKPNLSSSAQQPPTGAVAAMGGTGQALGQTMGGGPQALGQTMGGTAQALGHTMGGTGQGLGQTMGGAQSMSSTVQGLGQTMGVGQSIGGPGQSLGQTMSSSGQTMGGAAAQGLGQTMGGGQAMGGAAQGLGQTMGGGQAMGGTAQGLGQTMGTAQGLGQTMGSNVQGLGQTMGTNVQTLGQAMGGTAQALGQTMGQSTFSQGQLQGQLNSQQPTRQIIPGPVSLQGSNYLP